jgi:small subunit ribosomal protein S4
MRYTGSKAKRCRATGANLYGNEKFDGLKNDYPPGQHGQARKKKSEYANHLLEKQKIKWTYGLTERQLVTLYKEAVSAKAVTGEYLLALLERRLDNVLFKSGLFAGRDQCRQLVSHGHVLVNNKRLSIPSARLRVGDTITFQAKSEKAVRAILKQNPFQKPEWLAVDTKHLIIVFESIPLREHIDQLFQEHLLVEFYSR